MKKYDELIENISDNITIANDILKLNNNNHTKIKLDKDIRGNYYVFFNDTIYLKEKLKGYEKVFVISHEIVHSNQSNKMQIFNFILSNLEILLFIVIFILYFLNFNIFIISILYAIIVISSVVIRYIMEAEAIKKASNVAKKYLDTKLSKEDVNSMIIKYKEGVEKYTPLFILNLFVFKLIRLIIMVVLNYIK